MAPRKAAALRDGDRSLREHLIDTAERMIADHGTSGLTVRAIAREAGVADGVLYNHFTDKEELLANALLAHIDTVEGGLEPLPKPGTASVEANLTAYLAHGLALHEAILPAFVGLANQPAVLARFSDLTGGHQWRDHLTSYLDSEQTLGRITPDAEPEVAAALLVGICHETVLSMMLSHTPRATATPSVESVISTVLKGIIDY
ncbi:TetR family transcriptional regulator [Actinophytocola xinjiangensis]|uniref:TetR family transcriptional regulator n=1 Tax=Actinophytocola xinjiangensis TaxID=485602 RepID=A0A7Z0WG19_9PSEU|nr:TetR/AcrR family transcriptional regulator [Actinophytocola xinjiangensis]OLF06012.1 TetR family transcriptional regulator [Actinophytocola xinjiangensis]